MTYNIEETLSEYLSEGVFSVIIVFFLVHKKKYYFFAKKYLKYKEKSCILSIAVTLIAMKREVAAEKQVFRGANVKLGN